MRRILLLAISAILAAFVTGPGIAAIEVDDLLATHIQNYGHRLDPEQLTPDQTFLDRCALTLDTFELHLRRAHDQHAYSSDDRGKYEQYAGWDREMLARMLKHLENHAPWNPRPLERKAEELARRIRSHGVEPQEPPPVVPITPTGPDRSDSAVVQPWQGKSRRSNQFTPTGPDTAFGGMVRPDMVVAWTRAAYCVVSSTKARVYEVPNELVYALSNGPDLADRKLMLSGSVTSPEARALLRTAEVFVVSPPKVVASVATHATPEDLLGLVGVADAANCAGLYEGKGNFSAVIKGAEVDVRTAAGNRLYRPEVRLGAGPWNPGADTAWLPYALRQRTRNATVDFRLRITTGEVFTGTYLGFDVVSNEMLFDAAAPGGTRRLTLRISPELVRDVSEVARSRISR
jgi:hypothetical protein